MSGGQGRSEGDGRLVEGLASSTVLVVGDAMVDRYLRGDVDRISPEAPVPVVRVTETEVRPGGAANVAAGVAALGAESRFVSAVGRDEEGRRLGRLLSARGVEREGLLAVEDRPTTVKTRVVGRDQQMLRLDREDRSGLAPADRERIEEKVQSAMADVDAVAVSDYGKGLLDGGIVPRLIRAAGRRGVPVVVDPTPVRLGDCAGATVLTPNAREAGGPGAPESDRELAGLRDRLGVEHLLVTLGGDGMVLVDPAGSVERIDAGRVEVYDVTGAGDTVTAVLAAALPRARSVAAAARLANRAAALEVQKLGARPVTRAELRAGDGADPE